MRPESDAEYLAQCRRWAESMHHEMSTGRIPAPLHAALLNWEARNVGQFGAPRVSGDDCQETIAAQLESYLRYGLNDARVLWRKDLWAILFGRALRC